MSRVTLDAELRKRLGDLKNVVDFCDESGSIVGQFVPMNGSKPWEPVFDEARLQRIAQSSEWYTIDEVLSRLREPESK